MQSCGIPKTPQMGSAGMQSCGIKEEPRDPFFPGNAGTQNRGIRTPQAGPAGIQSHGIKAEPLDPFFPGSAGIPSRGIQEEPLDLFSPGNAGIPSRGIQEEPLDPFSPGSADPLAPQDLLAAPRGHSRKRSLPSAPSGIPNPELDPWEELEEKSLERRGVKREREEPDVDPLPDPHFGLLGTRNWEVPQGSMEDLPAEILRNIFTFLPVLDLYQNLSLVCHSWREIIRDPLFIPWKKLYHRYLRRDQWALQRVEQILQEFSITREHPGAVLGLISLVSLLPMGPKANPSSVLRILGSHPLFPKAQICLLHKFPDLKNKAGPQEMWATLALMVLFSDSVADIRRILDFFRSPSSELALLEVTEVLHCMATLLLAMRDRDIPISNRIHYNIFYSLNLMENSSGTVQPLEEGRGNLCSSGVQLTYEQQRILNHKIEPGHTVKIMAFAGTGKTSTLVKYAEKFQELKFLYLAFNKAVVEKGRKVFPRNVTCKTFHSLAFGSVGRLYKDKGKLNFSKMSTFSISHLLQNQKGQSLFVRGKTVCQTLENFFSSWDEQICEEHTPLWFKNTHGQMEMVSRKEKEIILQEAKDIWHKMKKLDGVVDKRYKITCDGYLKLWQLSKPQLSGYDVIFVDEAQDCTPAIVDIVQSQKCGKILVGDPHQQIYTFRGAINTLYSVPHTHVFYLTQSFRFGPEIAYVGSTILELCKGIRDKTLLGGIQEGAVRGAREGTVALLSRSNWNVFEDAVELSGRDPPAKIHVIGGLGRLGLSKIHDIWKLSQPAEVRKNSNLVIEDPFIKKWEEGKGFWGLKEYVEHVDDKDLEVKISIVEKYRERIPELLRRIQGSHEAQESLADFLIGTVHQAKGLEFDTVLVADDFVQVPPASGAVPSRMGIPQGRTSEDEWNLLYVAVTRAKKCLLLSKSLEHLLSLAGERFLRVELLGEAGKEQHRDPISCCVLGCENSVEFNSRLVVKKLPLTHSDGSRDLGGFLCQACSQKWFGSLAPLTSFPTIQEEPIQL